MAKRICILASGGDAPGMNACFEAIYHRASEFGLEVFAAMHGFDGLIDDDIVRVTRENGTGISGVSGCVFKCARSPRFKTRDGFASAIATIKKHQFDALIALGGDGSFIGLGRLKNAGVPLVGIPATIDNDVPFTKESLGFSSACENAVELIDMLKVTMETNGRDHVVQIMGRHCNDLAQTIGEATFADIIDMEGHRHTPKMVADIFAQKRRQGKTSCFMIMLERKNTDVVQEAIANANYLQELTQVSGNSSIRMNTLGHLQRGARPSCHDRFLAVTYGRAALDCVMRKKFGVSVAMINGQIKLVNIDLTPIP